MANLPQTLELRLRRSSVHRTHDMKRLDDGEDLNDALLDFFVKLGQVVIPCGGLEGGFPSVAYLGSLFYDVLRKGGVTDGLAGHANVANWARRRLGDGGLFYDGIGALAVPVNETLRESSGKSSSKEKHWWLALILNPRGGCKPAGEEDVSLVSLDSMARSEMRCDPPVRALRRGSLSYVVEVLSFYRQGFGAFVKIRASGDGSAGALPDPRKSRLHAGGRDFTRPQAVMSLEQRGSFGVPGKMEGTLEFALDSTARISGEYIFEFGEPGAYGPPVRLNLKRDPGEFQREVAHFLSGYVAKEWETATTNGASSQPAVVAYDAPRLSGTLRFPDVPQQETSNDCGFFILAQILMALELTPEAFRTLAGVSTDMLAALPWPSQRDVTVRKSKLRVALQALFAAADDMLTDDVELLLKKNPSLRAKIQSAMWDGPKFAEAVRRLAAASAPKQEYTQAELEAMPTKALRTLCAQRGLLPNGMVERADLLELLTPKPPAPPAPREAPRPPQPPQAQQPPTRASGPTGGPAGGSDATLSQLLSAKRKADATSGDADGKRARSGEQHLGDMRFSAGDLETMPLKTLRALCIQHRVLPANALERADFVRALTPLVDGKKPPPAATAAPAAPAAAAEAPAKPVVFEPELDMAARKEKWAKAAGEHLAGVRFDEVDLEVMPLKTLRALCIQHRVLPACAVERIDFVRALTPFTGKEAPGNSNNNNNNHCTPASKPSEPPRELPKKEPVRRDFSRFLGAAKPTFTAADLEDMPETTLRTLCIQHGVLPRGETQRSTLLEALRKVALPANKASVHVLDE